MIQPRRLADEALIETLTDHVGEIVSPELMETMRDEVIAIMKSHGINWSDRKDDISIDLIRPDVANMTIPEELLHGIAEH